MFSLPLLLLASVINMILSLFQPNTARSRNSGLEWFTTLVVLALMTIFGFVAVIAIGNFLFNL